MNYDSSMVEKWIEEFLECLNKGAFEKDYTVSHDLNKEAETLTVLLWFRRDDMYDVTYQKFLVDFYRAVSQQLRKRV